MVVVGAFLVVCILQLAAGLTRRQAGWGLAALPLALRRAPPAWARRVGASFESVELLASARAALDTAVVDVGKLDFAKARVVLKSSPVIELWAQGDSKNYALAEVVKFDDEDLVSLVVDLCDALEMTEESLYDNVFIYLPLGQLEKAQHKLDTLIAILKPTVRAEETNNNNNNNNAPSAVEETTNSPVAENAAEGPSLVQAPEEGVTIRAY